LVFGEIEDGFFFFKVVSCGPFFKLSSCEQNVKDPSVRFNEWLDVKLERSERN